MGERREEMIIILLNFQPLARRRNVSSRRSFDIFYFICFFPINAHKFIVPIRNNETIATWLVRIDGVAMLYKYV